MKKIFVIGNIGSGKSTLCKVLEDELMRAGKVAIVLNLDKVALSISRNSQIIEQITQEFGQYKDHKDLAKIVFHDKDALEKLNEITHPYIYREMLDVFKNNEDMGADYVIVEETAYSGKDDKFAKHADITICVICDNGLRQSRCIQKGMDLQDFEQRTNLQVGQITMMENADIIVNNNNDAVDLQEKIRNFLDKL